jgi:DNA-binding FadR family transcriptional regulator
VTAIRDCTLVVTCDQHRAGKAHRELLEVCKTKDPELVSAALWKHVTEAGRYLKEFIRRHREQQS